MWPERRIETDQAKARRVYQSLDKKLGEEGKRLVVQGFLTCLEEKVKMYEKMGFHNDGISQSTWGGEEWYEMSCLLR